MRRKAGLRGLVTGALLTIAGLLVGWLCVRETLVRVLPAASSDLLAIAAHDPDIVLERASAALVRQRGILAPATLDAVRAAAAAAPLDARAYLILGHQQLLDDQPRRAVATLEAGQRLDPRQRLIHILLLDRYLRTRHYADATAQFSVLARLMGQTQAPIATAMAAMMLDPETREAARRALATDPDLERAVLIALARSDTPATTVVALASPAARASAGNAQSWGPVLVTRLVERGRFAAARAVWQRINDLPDAAAAAAIFNPGFAASPASAPFNWTLAAGGLGAADSAQGGLAVDYYGRDSGDLAGQLVLLAPGRYRFSVVVDPGKTDAAARLAWTLACAGGNGTALMTAPVAAGVARRRISADFTVPAGCPAQALALHGDAGEFPVPVALTLRQPDIRPLPEARR